MKRDIVCLIRIIIDSFPEFIRNSKLLFNFSRLIFRVPLELFYFRKKYDAGLIKDISRYYNDEDNNSLKRISKTTDINSFHVRLIKKYFKLYSPKTLLDVGCGSGYLLNKLREVNTKTKMVGVDYQVPFFKNNKISYIKGEILSSISEFSDNQFEFVMCSHVIEHLENPDLVIMELKRICSGILIIICPIEKKFTWGLNYHVNFFSKKQVFIDFLKNILNEKNSKKFKFKTYYFLGDLMYLEFII